MDRLWDVHGAGPLALAWCILPAGASLVLRSVWVWIGAWSAHELSFPALVGVTLILFGGLLAGSYVASWQRRTFHRHTDGAVDRFAIGTWVAGVAVFAQTVLLALPAWRLLAIVLGLLSLTIWLWFLTVAAWAFQAIVLDPKGQHVTGSILLSTVATQSVAIRAVTLFPGRIPLVPLATLFPSLPRSERRSWTTGNTLSSPCYWSKLTFLTTEYHMPCSSEPVTFARNSGGMRLAAALTALRADDCHARGGISMTIMRGWTRKEGCARIAVPGTLAAATFPCDAQGDNRHLTAR